MDGVIRLYKETAEKGDVVVEIGFTLAKEKLDDFNFRIVYLLNSFETNPNVEIFDD